MNAFGIWNVSMAKFTNCVLVFGVYESRHCISLSNRVKTSTQKHIENYECDVTQWNDSPERDAINIREQLHTCQCARVYCILYTTDERKCLRNRISFKNTQWMYVCVWEFVFSHDMESERKQISETSHICNCSIQSRHGNDEHNFLSCYIFRLIHMFIIQVLQKWADNKFVISAREIHGQFAEIRMELNEWDFSRFCRFKWKMKIYCEEIEQRRELRSDWLISCWMLPLYFNMYYHVIESIVLNKIELL